MPLAIYGGLWGLLFGALMDLWFWPFAVGPATQHWQAGVGLGETVKRFAAFYIATSLLWDMVRSAGTVALILLFGEPTLRTLRRFARRFAFKVEPLSPAPASGDLEAAVGAAAPEACA